MRIVEPGAFFSQHAAGDLDVIAKRIGDKISGIQVPRFKVHAVDIAARRAIDDPRNLGPDTGHGAHSATLQRAVKRAPVELRGLQLPSQPAQGHDLGVRRRIESTVRFVKTLRQHFAIPHNHAADFARSGFGEPPMGLLQGKPHPSFVFRRLCHLALFLAIPSLLAAGIGGETSQAVRSVELDPSECYRIRELQITRGDIQFFFTDGYLAFSKPVLGAPIAAVFSSMVDAGDGEILLLPPDRDERRILSLRAGSGNLEEHLVDAAFFFADNTAAELRKQIEASESNRRDPQHGIAMAEHYNPVLRNLVPEFETRLILDLLTGPHAPSRFFAALLGGKTLGGFDIVFDPRATEQVLVGKTRAAPQERGFEVWASYTPKSLRGAARPADFHADHYRIESTIDPALHMSVQSSFTVSDVTRELRALSFDLSRKMQVTGAEVDGKPAEIVESPNSETPGEDPGDRVFLVVPSEPLLAGSHHTVKVAHAGDVITADPNHVYFVGSRGRWYPHRALEFARFDLQFRFPKDLDLVAPGDSFRDTVEGNERVIERRLDTPVPMAGFNLGSYHRTVVKRGDLTIEMFANQESAKLLSSSGMSAPVPGQRPRAPLLVDARPAPDNDANPYQREQEIAGTIVDIMDFYAHRFGPPPLKKLIVSPIPGKFGQGFAGLIYLSTMAYMSPSGKAFAQMNPESKLFFTELMQAHEVAHQWWGNLVLTASYHDEWINEALANYSAMLYLEARSGPKPASILLNAYRAGLFEKNKDGVPVEQAGPVTEGRRLELEGEPSAWITIMYGKGTWVIQMLRARMGEQAFWNMLAELRRRYERKNLTTEQFRDLCAEFLPPGASDPKLRDFFDQWVYGMGIPSLKLSTKVSGAGAGRGGAGNFRLNATLSQSGVPDDFSADFPVRIELRGKQIVKWVQSSSEPVSFSLSLSSRPEHVSLDPDDQFLKR